MHIAVMAPALDNRYMHITFQEAGMMSIIRSQFFCEMMESVLQLVSIADDQ